MGKTIHMKKAILCLFLLLGVYSLRAQGLSQKDIQFATDAYRCGMLNIRLAELTIGKAKSDSVRVLGRQIVIDHTKANEQMKSIAMTKTMAMPDSLSKAGQQHYDDLSKLTGSRFDSAYVQLVITEHKKAIDAFRTQEESGSDPEVRNWASMTLPVLKHHLMIAQDLAVDLDKSKTRKTKSINDKNSTLKQ